jgi:hypothetical protein
MVEVPSYSLVWSQDKANEWYACQAWPVGGNFLPAYAINQLEMWQEDTFNPAEIEKELSWAQDIGFNTMRVFLHDLLWEQDKEGFTNRINIFLEIAARHGIKPMLVLFDSCWDPNPKLGKQRTPTPGVHNSGWVQSPGLSALQNAAEHERLHAYVTGIVQAFAEDERILCWDVWNEPDNLNTASYADPEEKTAWVLGLLPKVFAWAREAKPSQPLTSGVWNGNWSSEQTLNAVESLQLTLSDIISFHNYGDAEEFNLRINWLARHNRPMLCTEYMARCNKSTFQELLPVMKEQKIAAYNWGFVAGKSQTNIPWDSWQKPYTDEPQLWFHDIFRTDGTCYREDETQCIRILTGKAEKIVVPSLQVIKT